MNPNQNNPQTPNSTPEQPQQSQPQVASPIQPTQPQPQPQQQVPNPTPQQPQVVNQQSIGPQPAHLAATKKNPTLMYVVAGVFVLILVLIGIVVMTSSETQESSSSGSSNTPQLSEEDQALLDEIDAQLEEKTEAPSEPEATTEEVKVGKGATNDLGVKFTVDSIVRNYQTDASTEIILVKITATGTSDKYSSVSVRRSDFNIFSDTQTEPQEQTFSVSGSDMESDGYPQFPIDSVKKGESVSGYIAFELPRSSQTITLRIIQRETTVIGSSQNIPSKNFDVVIIE